jgi:site-specific recombinase XerD
MRITDMPAKAPLPKAWENALASFENDLYRRECSERTVVTYGSCLQNFARFYRRELQKPGPYIARLEESDLIAFIDHIQYDRRLSAPSVNRYIAALRAFSNFIMLKRWHRRLLSRDLKSYRIDNSRPPARLSRKEVRLMIAAVEEKSRNAPRNMALLQLMLQCGLRVGDMVPLI